MKGENQKEENTLNFNLHPSNFNLILERLPHRYPFLMVDRVLEMVPGQKARGIKLITGNEDYIKGWDPANPHWPGIFFVEALAQLAAIVASGNKGPGSGRGLLVQIKNFQVHRNPLPGEVVFLEVERVKSFGALHQFEGRALIEKEIAAQGELVFTLTA